MSSRPRAVGELVLAVVFAALFATVALTLVTELAAALHVGPSPVAELAAVGLGLAMLIPATRLAARAFGRDPGALSSATGRLRWGLVRRCGVVALGVVVASFVVVGAAELALDGWSAASDGLAWQGASGFVPAALVVLLLFPLQAAGEEYLFRGTLVQAIGTFTPRRWVAIAITSAAFGAIHMYSAQGTVSVLAFGAVAAWLTLRTGGLEAAIGLHVVNNVVSLVLRAAFLDPSTLLAEPASPSWVLAAIDVATTLAYAAIVTRVVFPRSAARVGPARPAAPAGAALAS